MRGGLKTPAYERAIMLEGRVSRCKYFNRLKRRE
jgi:hypothetical protein